MRDPSPGLVAGIRPGSLAEEAGIEPGDTIVTVAGRVPRDVVDVQFYSAENEVEVLVRKANGLDELLLFEKEIDEDLGLEFDRATWDEVTLCNNNCFFCFLKGLPKGMRKTLYMKDDDYRLSFLHGNFVTLTNLTDDDWARLEEQRLSPLNVSVHATELGLRRRMLGNDDAPDIIAQLQRLGKMGLSAHTQIVLCPGVNDGEHLERSVRDLGASSFQPSKRSPSCPWAPAQSWKTGRLAATTSNLCVPQRSTRAALSANFGPSNESSARASARQSSSAATNTT